MAVLLRTTTWPILEPKGVVIVQALALQAMCWESVASEAPGRKENLERVAQVIACLPANEQTQMRNTEAALRATLDQIIRTTLNWC